MRIRSIRTKFVVGFFLIFAAAFLLLNQTITRIVQTSNQKIITDDLVGLKKTGQGYAKQAYLIHHFSSDEAYFGQIAEELVGDLRYATSSSVGAYSLEGKLLFASEPDLFSGENDEDLARALNGATVYTISYEGGTASVLYAFPVLVDGVKIGILRFAKTFDPLYEQSSKILSTVFYTALAIFAAAFLFSFLLSRHITIPLVKLADASTKVREGDLRVRLDTDRSDEIGRLTANFNEMIAQIENQFERIERDRDRLKKLNAQRKQFFDNVTHELKTPLTSILGYAQIIRENGESDEAFFRKGMDHIVEESQRLHVMVVTLLETSKGRELHGWDEQSTVEAGSLLRDVCDAMAFKAQRYKKTIRAEIEEGLLVDAHPDKLRQLFINLVDNAIKYGEALSDIEVGARAVPDDGTVRFTVANRGEPIPKERLQILFEPYANAGTERHEEGSVGLGLSIARAIVEDLGGTIAMASDRGRTVVLAELPAKKPEGWT